MDSKKIYRRFKDDFHVKSHEIWVLSCKKIFENIFFQRIKKIIEDKNYEGPRPMITMREGNKTCLINPFAYVYFKDL